MKKIICLILTCLVLAASLFTAFAKNDEQLWTDGYLNIINITKISDDTQFVLVDTDYDEIPELFCGDSDFITAFSFENGSVIKLYETYGVPIEYIANMKAFYNTSSQITEFSGQAFLPGNTKPSSYKLDFSKTAVRCTVFGDVRAKNYFNNLLVSPLAIAVLDKDELNNANKAESFARFTDRYIFLDNLSDDTATFSFKERNKIKSEVAQGSFLCFEKISRLSEDAVFVQYYSTYDNADILIPYKKRFALILSDKEELKTYKKESEIDLDFINSVKNESFDASNVYIDYSKARSFLSFDEHIKYFENLVSENKNTANENGKTALYNYAEFAVNKSARTQLKSKNNVYTIDKNVASLVSQYANECMDTMVTVLKSGKLLKDDKLRNVPAVVCVGLDLAKPVRIEFKSGVSKSLSSVTGLKIMLNDTHGIYLTTEEIKVLEASIDSFCIEINHSPGKVSVCFADRNNNIIKKLDTAISFILPANNKFSFVYAISGGKSSALGGYFNLLNKTVTFKTKTPGVFEVLNSDITLNDAKEMNESADAALFLACKGAISPDKANNFNQDNYFSNYEFTKSAIKLFYNVSPNATASFSDVFKDNEFYPYVATAEELGLTLPASFEDFNGDAPVTHETAAAICGRVLVKSGLFAYSADKTLPFADKNKISKTAAPDIKVLLDAGVIDSSERFLPNKKLNKKECAVLLYNTYMALSTPCEITTVSSIKVPTAPASDESVLGWEFGTAIIIIAGMLILFIGYIIRKLIKRRQRLLKEKGEKRNE